MLDGSCGACGNLKSPNILPCNLSDMKATENGAAPPTLTNGDTGHDNGETVCDEEEELLKEMERLQEENKLLKKTQLREKIETLRRENCRLRAQIEADEANSEPTSSTNGGEKISIAPFGEEMKSQSFIFTSSNGGTLYIKPLDISPGDLEKMSLDGIIDSMGDMDNSYTYALGGWSKPLALSSLCNREKHTQTNGSQTPPNYNYMYPQQNYPGVTPPQPASKNKKAPNSYSPLNKCGSFTTQEDLEARRFVQEFKARRVAHKLTQSDIGERLNRCTGARYGQSYISRLESMQLSTAIVLRMKPLLNRLLDETENGMFAEGLGPPTRKKTKSNSGGGKRKSNPAPRTSLNFGQEIDDEAHNKPPFQRSASVPVQGWNYQVPHHHVIASGQQLPSSYAEQGNNFFVSGLMSSLNPGVLTSRSDTPSSCSKVSDPMEVALNHTELYNPYRMSEPFEPKHEVTELSPVQPRPPHPSPASVVLSDDGMASHHHDTSHHSGHNVHKTSHHSVRNVHESPHCIPPAPHNDPIHHISPHHSFSPNLHELTPAIKADKSQDSTGSFVK